MSKQTTSGADKYEIRHEERQPSSSYRFAKISRKNATHYVLYRNGGYVVEGRKRRIEAIKDALEAGRITPTGDVDAKFDSLATLDPLHS